MPSTPGWIASPIEHLTPALSTIWRESAGQVVCNYVTERLALHVRTAQYQLEVGRVRRSPTASQSLRFARERSQPIVKRKLSYFQKKSHCPFYYFNLSITLWYFFFVCHYYFSFFRSKCNGMNIEEFNQFLSQTAYVETKAKHQLHRKANYRRITVEFSRI